MTPNEASALAALLTAAARDLDQLLAVLRITGPLGSAERLEIVRLLDGLPDVITFLTAGARNLRKLQEPQEAKP